MFCHKCGKEIDDDAVVCIHCGSDTKNLKRFDDKPINIVNQNSASSVSKNKTPRVYNGFVDFIMICLTGGLWIIWMICRPKYY